MDTTTTTTSYRIQYFSNGMWYDQPHGDYAMLEDARAALRFILDVCGHDPNKVRFVEVEESRRLVRWFTA